MKADLSGAILLVVVKPDLTIRSASPHLEERFGWLAGTLAGQSHDVLIPERSRAVHDEHWRLYMQNPESRQMGPDREVLMRCHDGSELPVWVGLSPQDNGDVVAVVLPMDERTGPLNLP